MTARYTRADKTCDTADAQIWVVYYGFRDKCTHPFIKVPIESSLLAQSGKHKYVGEAGPANQNQAFKHRIKNKMADIRVEELSKFKRLLWII